MIHSFHSQPISAIDERRSPKRLLDKVAEKVRLVRKVQALDTSFRHNAAVVGLTEVRSCA
jgi:hypothetical protein